MLVFSAICVLSLTMKPCALEMSVSIAVKQSEETPAIFNFFFFFNLFYLFDDIIYLIIIIIRVNK